MKKTVRKVHFGLPLLVALISDGHAHDRQRTALDIRADLGSATLEVQLYNPFRIDPKILSSSRKGDESRWFSA